MFASNAMIAEDIRLTTEDHHKAQDKLALDPTNENLQRDCLEANRRRNDAERN